MALLTAAELPTYYAEAANMQATDVTKFLARANGYCLGVIGGVPPAVTWDANGANLKAIVANAFEILAEGQTAQTDPTTGIITEAAPTASINRSANNSNPLAAVDKMLLPYKREFEQANAEDADDGVTWLGG